MTDQKYNNKPLAGTSSSTLHDASFVCGISREEVELSNKCLDPPSPPSLVIVSIPTPIINQNTNLSPPRPPRSPKRARLADIAEERSDTEPIGKAEKGLVALRTVLAGFVSRLEAIPPPESPDSPDLISSHSNIPSSVGPSSHRRSESLPTLKKMTEHDRSRTASDGTFGPGIGGHGVRESGQGITEGPITPQSATDTLPGLPQFSSSDRRSLIPSLKLASQPTDSDLTTTTPAPMPSLHVTRPSTSSDAPGPEAFEAIVNMMNKDNSRNASATNSSGQSSSIPASGSQLQDGKAQIPRKGMMGPNAILGQCTHFSLTDIPLIHLSQSQILLLHDQAQEPNL